MAKQLGLKSFSEEDGSDEAALQAKLAKLEKDAARAEADLAVAKQIIANAVGSAVTAKEVAAKRLGGSKGLSPSQAGKSGMPLASIGNSQASGSVLGKRQAADAGLEGKALKKPTSSFVR